jgi:hypothetical protein
MRCPQLVPSSGFDGRTYLLTPPSRNRPSPLGGLVQENNGSIAGGRPSRVNKRAHPGATPIEKPQR